MRRVDVLIDVVRERTKNKEYTVDGSTGATTAGISQSQFLEFLNNAQEHLQAAIIAQNPNEFVECKTISLVANQEEYEVEDNVFANNKIVLVEYNRNSNTTDYDPLPQGGIRDRDSRTGTPSFYIRRAGKILLNPIPSSSVGTIRVSYYRALDKLDIRRGFVASKTLSATNLLTALTLSTTGDDPIALAAAEYLCVCKLNGGEVEAYNIPITGYASGTGIVSLPSGGVQLDTGEGITVGSYVTCGEYTTAHSKLDNICERYLITYAQKRILAIDSNQTSVEEDEELKKIENDILSVFVMEGRDVVNWPVLDTEILS